MNLRTILAAAMLTAVGCATRGAASTSPPAPVAAQSDAAACAIAGPFALEPRRFASRLYRSTDQLAFVATASGLMLVHSDIVGEWTQIEFAGTRPTAQRRGTSRIRPGFGIELDLGARWAYVTTLNGAASQWDVALGDLHDPGALRRIDPHPGHDHRPRLTAGHDGGSALVWTRSFLPADAEQLRFAIVGADHQIHVVRDLASERSPVDARLLRTPGGFALLHTEYSSDPRVIRRAAPQLVLTLLDHAGESVRRQVLFAGNIGSANAIVTANAIDVIFAEGSPQRALYLRTDLDGAIVTPARPIYADPHSLANVDPAAIAYHRGLLWSVLHVDYVGEHRQMARPRTLLVPVALDGRAAAPIALSRRVHRGDQLALGVAENALLVAWSTGPWSSRARLWRLHAAELRCSAHENG